MVNTTPSGSRRTKRVKSRLRTRVEIGQRLRRNRDHVARALQRAAHFVGRVARRPAHLPGEFFGDLRAALLEFIAEPRQDCAPVLPAAHCARRPAHGVRCAGFR